MTLSLSARFDFTLFQPTDTLMQFEAAAMDDQRILSAHVDFPPAHHFARVPAKDGIGERIWLRAEGRCEVTYQAELEVERVQSDMAPLGRMEPHDLPGPVVEYLLESRYCQARQFSGFVADTFAGLSGGALILAMRDWAATSIAYRPGTSTALTTAMDTFQTREGICRDFAHVMVGLSRAAMIPARYASCFAPGVKPQDFHAVAEVYLADPAAPCGGAWHLVDATGMADADHTAIIGVGRDAADVSFLTTFGAVDFHSSQVDVRLS